MNSTAVHADESPHIQFIDTDHHHHDPIDVHVPGSAVADSKALELNLESSSARVSRLLFTTCYCFCFGAMGAAAAILGPTLTDLGIQTGAPVAQLSSLFAVRALAAMTGAGVGGWWVDHRPAAAPLIVFVAVLTMALFVAIIPLCTSFVLLAFACAMTGLAIGVVGNVGQIIILRAYGDTSKPYIQALHFSFGAGALISPLIAGPFVHADRNAATTDVVWAYMIVAGTVASIAIWALYYVLKPEAVQPNHSTHVSESTNGDHTAAHAPINLDQGSDGGRVKSVQVAAALDPALVDDVEGAPVGRAGRCSRLMHVLRAPRTVIIVVSAVMLGFYVGLESSFGGLLYTYAVDFIELEAEQATALTALYWGSFAFGRLAAIYVSIKMSPSRMLRIDFLGLQIAILALVLSSSDKSVPALWIGTTVAGISLASIYPTAVNLVQQYVSLTGSLMFVMLIGDTAGDMIIPLLTGTLMDPQTGLGPGTFPYSLLFSFIATLLCFVLLQVLVRSYVLSGQLTLQSALSAHQPPYQADAAPADDRRADVGQSTPGPGHALS